MITILESYILIGIGFFIGTAATVYVHEVRLDKSMFNVLDILFIVTTWPLLLIVILFMEISDEDYNS